MAEILEIIFCVFLLHCNSLIPLAFNCLIYIKGLICVVSELKVYYQLNSLSSILVHSLFDLPSLFILEVSVFSSSALCGKMVSFSWLEGTCSFHPWVLECMLILQSGEEMELSPLSCDKPPRILCHQITVSIG